MAFTIPNTPASPTAEQSSQSSPDQRDFDALVAGFNETYVASGCAVTANNNMAPSVAAGSAVVAGARVTVSGGTVTITTADATNPRIDAVVVDNTGAKSVIAGTPASVFDSTHAGPVIPDLAGKCLLAVVYVAAATTSIASADIIDKRILVESGPALARNWDVPTGVVLQNYLRGNAIANATGPTTQQMRLTAIWLPKGFVVTTIYFMSATTALAVGSHGWFALYSYHATAPVLLGQSADDTSPAFAANTVKGYNLASPVTITASGLYYCGTMFQATTVPTYAGVAGSATTGPALAPFLCGNSSGSLTGTAPNPAATISPTANTLWCGVS